MCMQMMEGQGEHGKEPGAPPVYYSTRITTDICLKSEKKCESRNNFVFVDVLLSTFGRFGHFFIMFVNIFIVYLGTVK